MGCGTAVLAILARLKGAKRVAAIDIDEWAYNNALENIRLNHTEDIQVPWARRENQGIRTIRHRLRQYQPEHPPE